MMLVFRVRAYWLLLWVVAQGAIAGLKLDGPLHRWEWLWVISPLWGFGILAGGMMLLSLVAGAVS
jgi:hypothetical protein